MPMMAPGETYAGGKEPGEVQITVAVTATYELLAPGA